MPFDAYLPLLHFNIVTVERLITTYFCKEIYTCLIARRHGHVFRMALHNEGDWRMETWQRARQGELSCLHTPIPELCNAILNTCQMPSRFYIIPSNVNKSQTHLLKPFIARDLMEGHICRWNTLMFALVFCLNCVHAPPARAVTAISLWKIRFMTASAVS